MHGFSMGGSKLFFSKQQTNDMKSLFGRNKQNSELIFLTDKTPGVNKICCFF